MTIADILVAGTPACGDALVLSAPISFWGGVDPASGTIMDVRHPQHGACIAGRILFLPGAIGSSSASSVMLELVHAEKAPAAIVMAQPDAILLLGLIVAREMRWPTPIAVRLDAARFGAFENRRLNVSAEGEMSLAG